jgi:hypothetical protein
MWKNPVEPDRPQITIWLIRSACWIIKATSTHSEYVLFIAFVLQQWLHERASMLRCTYISCLAMYSINRITDVRVNFHMTDISCQTVHMFSHVEA